MNRVLFWKRVTARAASVSLALAPVCAVGVVAAAEATAEKRTMTAETLSLPKRKQTSLGLYVTAKEAYEKWKAAPDKVRVIDVRTPEEYAFVGHPEMAWNIPFAFVTYQRKNGKTEYGPRMNPDFVTEVKAIAKPNDILLVTCRSGDRSARAVDMLAAAGFTYAYSVVDGVEGDKVTDPENVFYGKRMKNGWKNSAPWVYTIDPEKIILEESATSHTQ